MNARQQRRVKRVAYHEAGHAVAAYIVRRRWQYATIEPTDDSLGHIRYFPAPATFHPDADEDTRTRYRLEQYATTALGGVVAEAKLIGSHNWVGASADLRQAVDWLDYLSSGPDETGAYVGWMLERTRGLLRQEHWWLAVEHLAAALLVHRRLDYRRCRQLIASAIDDYVKQPWPRNGPAAPPTD